MLRVNHNNLSGQIPPELGYNELDGEMPQEFGKLVDLLSLSLTGNHLSRKIPPELDDLVNLAWLDLSHTKWIGCVTAGLRDHLREFALGG